MAAELLTDLSRATDSNSSPLSGATWTFYATGTTTPQSVYTTAALDVAHANPVVADSAGLFAPIYFDGSKKYRGVQKSAGGTTLQDIDPINVGRGDIDAILANADATFYVNASTGNDTTGNGSSGSPYATPQKAIDAASLLTGRKSVVIDIAAGTYSTSSRTAASMDRPAVIYIDGMKIGKRTAQSGSTLSGGLVLKLAAGAKITPNTTYPRGIYVTGHVGSVGIVGGEIEAAAGGTEALLATHRGAYVHCRDLTLDGNSIATFGLLSEAGGIAEMIDCTATGSTVDCQVYAGGFAQWASPADTCTIGSITNCGVISLGDNVVVTGLFLDVGERFESVVSAATKAVDLQGDYFGNGGQVIGPWVNWTDSSARVEFHNMAIRGDVWKFDAQFHLFNTEATGNGWESFIAGSNSPHAEPMLLYGASQFSGRYSTGSSTWGTNTIRNSAGILIGPQYYGSAQTFSASAGTIALHWSGGRHTVTQLSNSTGGTLTNMVLAGVLATGSRGAGDTPPDGSLWTFYTTSTNSLVIIPGSSIVTLPGGAITLGTAAAAMRLVTLKWSRALARFQLVSWVLNIQTAPISTYSAPATTPYTAPSGGATQDAECRTAVDQLKAIVDNVVTSMGQLNADTDNHRTKTSAAKIHS